MADKPSYRTTRWFKHFEEIDNEIAKYAAICRVDMLQPGVIQRVLDNDTTVCGAYSEASFKKMRNLLMMHYSVREKAVVALGPQETLRIVDEIVARLRKRFGGSPH
jgi:hypothetical protein